jgi:hypothetical protein
LMAKNTSARTITWEKRVATGSRTASTSAECGVSRTLTHAGVRVLDLIAQASVYRTLTLAGRRAQGLPCGAALNALAAAGLLTGRTRFTLAGGDVEDLSRGAAGGDALAAAQHGTRGAHDVLALAGRCV